MSYLDFDFPHTRFFESDLRELIKQVFIMNDLVTNFVSINAIKYADPLQWNITKSYEKNTVVIDGNSGVAYISVRPVPAGVALTREQYWTKVFDLSVFITKGSANFARTYESEPTTTATMSTDKDEWLVWDTTLYQALTNIHPGDRYVVDGNIKRMTVEDFYDILKSIIDNEIHEREAGDDALELALNEETELRSEGDNALHQEIVKESVDRKNADTTLQDNIDEEISAREIADNALSEQIDNLRPSPVVDVTKRGVIMDGITDNTTIFQELLNDASGSYILYVPRGVCILSGVTVPSNTHIILDGELKLKNDTPAQLLYCLRGENITIEGSGTLNGNKTNQSSTLAIACILFGGASSEKEYDVNNVLIKGITIKNALFWGASLIGDNNTFDGVTFADNNYMSFIGPYSRNGTFRNCEAYGVVNDWGMGFYGGVDGGLIDNCIAHHNNQTGLGALSDEAQPRRSTNIKIVNCTCYANEMGIAVGGGGAGSDIIIANNYCYDADVGGQFDVGGISVFNQNNVSIHDNVLTNNDNGVGSGILVFGECSNINVHHNTIINTDAIGIRLYGTIAVNVNIDANDINADTAIAYYNAYTAVVKNTITNNNIKGNLYIPYSGTAVVTMSNNLINTSGTYLRTRSSGYVEFTPDGNQTTFSFSASDIRLFGSIKTITLSPRNDYGGYRVTISDSTVTIIFATAPSSGYGTIRFDYLATSTLED